MDGSTPHDGPARAHEAADRVGRGIDEARDRVASLRGDAAAFIRARPGVALLLAFGAGYLIGRALR